MVDAFQRTYAGGPFDAFLSRIDVEDQGEEDAAGLLLTDGRRDRGCRNDNR